ncbi:MAG: class I SAM-dependent methyltransferase [Bacteroidetes bacterium]|nr:class I SAM-dependent methyltransferase [Bacteroidota bacterium]
MYFNLLQFLKYWIKGKTIFRLHSPFIFDFASVVLNEDRHFYAFKVIDIRRKVLLKEQRKITLHDFGAGSKTTDKNERSIASITKNSSVSPKYGRLLFRMIEHYKPKHILEMGSCVGIGTLYLSTPQMHLKLISLEGDPVLASIARNGIEQYPLTEMRAEVIEGEFSKTLPIALDTLERIDLAYIDGNHRKEPTLQYFEQILVRCHKDSILIFDDIYWSKEMSEAWETIKKHKKVKVTIDLFRMGLVFFREENREKEDFLLYY